MGLFGFLHFRFRTPLNFSYVGTLLPTVRAVKWSVPGTWYLVPGTWTQPVLGQDFTVLWLATLGRGINIMMRNIGPPRVSQILEKKKSRLHWLRPRLTAGYLLTGLCTDRAMHTCSRSSVRGTLY